MLLTFNLLVQILFCTAFTNNTKQHGRHWRPLESGLWWILLCNNTDAFSCSDTASWLRRSSREEAATTVASNDNTYGIEQNCVYGPLPWPEKSQWLKRITPSVSTETCDVSQPMKVLSDTYRVWFPTFWVLRQLCVLSYDNQLVYWNLPAVEQFIFREATDMKASFTCIFEIHGVSHAKNNNRYLFSSSAKFLMP